MSVYKKAHELAQELEKSEELVNLRESEIEIKTNEEAKKLIEEYQDIQELFMKKSFEELSSSEQAKVENLEQKMSENEIINDYMDNQNKLEQLLKAVNLIISSALNEQCECDDCSDH